MIKFKHVLPVLAALAILAQFPARALPAAADGNWVASWTAAPQGLWDASFPLPAGIAPRLHDQTVRERVRLSAGGRRLRLVFSNLYGDLPLHIGEVRVALAQPSGAKREQASSRSVTFAGSQAVWLAPGKEALSDPVELNLPALAHVVVSSYYPQPTAVTTFHWGGQQRAQLAQGNRTGDLAMAAASSFPGRAFLRAIEVDAAPGTRLVVAFGDSITDGNGSTPERNRRWPDQLAQALARRHVAVVNGAISGARVLGDLMGENALARFERDVLAQPGVATVVVLMGINDIGWPGSPFAPHDPQLDPERLFAAYRQLVERAHARQVRVIGATLPPFEGALRGTPFEGHYSAGKELLRQQVNHWIRQAGVFDAVLDTDALLRDPRHPSRMQARYDSGDHLHPGDAGYQAIAAALAAHALLGKAGTQARAQRSP